MKNEYRETLVKSMSIMIILIVFSIFIISVSYKVTEKLDFKYPDRILKIQENGKDYIVWDAITLNQYIKILINSNKEEFLIIRDKIFSYNLKIKEENLKNQKKEEELIINRFIKEKIFNSKIISIKPHQGKYYRNQNNVLKETIKEVKIIVLTEERKYKTLLIQMDYKNLIYDIKIKENDNLNKLSKLESLFQILSKENFYKYFAASLRSDIRIQRVVLISKPLQKINFFIVGEKEYIIIKVDKTYRLEIKEGKIVKMIEIEEKEKKIDYLLF